MSRKLEIDIDLICEALSQMSFELFEKVENGTVKHLEEFLMSDASRYLESK